MAEKVDELVWKKKDFLYARQTAANVTSAVFEGKEILSEDFMKYADDIFNWLFQEQDKLKTEQQGVLPTPTQAQQKILEAIAHEVGVEVNDDLKLKVITWANEVHTIRKYPESQKSILEIVKYLGE